MAVSCEHLQAVDDVTPSSEGCQDGLRDGSFWVHPLYDVSAARPSPSHP